MLICPNCHLELSNDKCNSCQFQTIVRDGIRLLLSTKDSENPIFSDYQKNYDIISNDDLTDGILVEEYAEIQADKLYSYLGDLVNLNVCDIGVGKGRLISRLLKSKAKSVTGVDISMSYLSRIAKLSNISVIQANAENLPFKEEFDLVVASDILEHVLNVGDFLVSLNRSVKLGGRAVIRVPYLENLCAYAKQNGCKYDYVHLRTFSRRSLTEMMLSAGFKPIDIQYDGFISYRVRDYINNSRILRYLFVRKILSRYPNSISIASISNFWGRLLMRPVEITIVAIKTKQSTTM